MYAVRRRLSYVRRHIISRLIAGCTRRTEAVCGTRRTAGHRLGERGGGCPTDEATNLLHITAAGWI